MYHSLLFFHSPLPALPKWSWLPLSSHLPRSSELLNQVLYWYIFHEISGCCDAESESVLVIAVFGRVTIYFWMQILLRLLTPWMHNEANSSVGTTHTSRILHIYVWEILELVPIETSSVTQTAQGCMVSIASTVWELLPLHYLPNLSLMNYVFVISGLV